MPTAGRSRRAGRTVNEWFRQYLEHAPVAIAIVRATDHTLVHANSAFRLLSGLGGGAGDGAGTGRPVADALAPGAGRELDALLVRVTHGDGPVRDVVIASVRGGSAAWHCSVWPVAGTAGLPEQLVIEVRETTDADRSLARQTDIAERLLLSALREQELAEAADTSRRRAAFLAAAAALLGRSLGQDATNATVASLALPRPGAWCIVDVIDADGTLRRLPVVHSDPAKQALLREITAGRAPAPDDPLGVPLVMRSPGATVVADGIDAVLAAAARDAGAAARLRELGVGPLLVVPLLARGRLCGAITFVSHPDDLPYSQDDVDLTEDLAARCAMALDSARLYDAERAARADLGTAYEQARSAQAGAEAARATADVARVEAEEANAVKAQFLATMSHELRTPLNAIGGYAQLMEMGLRGPVTDEQREDLARIQRSQEHLLGLINAVLNYAKLEAGRVQYSMADVALDATLITVEALVAPQLRATGLSYRYEPCDEPQGGSPSAPMAPMAPSAPVLVRADPEKLRQILINLLTNAMKFTEPGGQIVIRCTASESTVTVRVSDTGRGIPPGRLASIFDPFVQVGRRLTSTDQGVGLGLAISRDLARGMGGDLSVESTVGEGSVFTLTLPRAAA